jgi:hypothetical protein
VTQSDPERKPDPEQAGRPNGAHTQNESLNDGSNYVARTIRYTHEKRATATVQIVSTLFCVCGGYGGAGGISIHKSWDYEIYRSRGG